MAEGRGVALQLDLPPLKWESLDPAKMVLDYDRKSDILHIRPPKARPATSFDIDDEVWIRIDLETGEVVGIEIDDFELVFLKKHPEVAAVWPGAKSKASERVRFFLEILADFLRTLVGDNPQQPALFAHS